MQFFYLFIPLLTVVQSVLLLVIAWKYRTIAKNEKIVRKSLESQEKFLRQIETNSIVEQNLVDSLGMREINLKKILGLIEDRTDTLTKMLDIATGITRSSQFSREKILEYRDKGYSANQIVKITGCSLDEVKLILSV